MSKLIYWQRSPRQQDNELKLLKAKDRYAKEVTKIISGLPVDDQQVAVHDAINVAYQVYRELTRYGSRGVECIPKKKGKV